MRYARVVLIALLFLPSVMFTLWIWLKASAGLAMLWMKPIENWPHDWLHTAVMIAGVIVCFLGPGPLVRIWLGRLFEWITELVGDLTQESPRSR